MDFFYRTWVEYWFDAPAYFGRSLHDQLADELNEADYILHGPQLPYSYREFALDGATTGVIQEPAPWIPPWHQLTYVGGDIYRDFLGSYWADWGDADGPCFTELEFGPATPPVQGPHERWDPLF
jgi:hypothetical protein